MCLTCYVFFTVSRLWTLLIFKALVIVFWFYYFILLVFFIIINILYVSLLWRINLFIGEFFVSWRRGKVPVETFRGMSGFRPMHGTTWRSLCRRFLSTKAAGNLHRSSSNDVLIVGCGPVRLAHGFVHVVKHTRPARRQLTLLSTKHTLSITVSLYPLMDAA